MLTLSISRIFSFLFVCSHYRVVSPLETLPPGDPNGGVVYLRNVLSPEEASRFWHLSLFLEETIQEK
jgi:hypothetical protein